MVAREENPAEHARGEWVGSAQRLDIEGLVGRSVFTADNVGNVETAAGLLCLIEESRHAPPLATAGEK